MIIRLDMASEVPIYVQLRNAVVIGIGKGELVPGEGLPTVRQMAEDLINHHGYQKPEDWRSWNYVNHNAQEYAPAVRLTEAPSPLIWRTGTTVRRPALTSRAGCASVPAVMLSTVSLMLYLQGSQMAVTVTAAWAGSLYSLATWTRPVK